jgi:hypothetical protein
MNLKIFILAISAAFFCAACSPQQEPAPSDYDQANQDIEQGKLNSAIQLMTDRLNQNAHDQKARVILASAYAARGGVYLKRYLNLAEALFLSDEAAQDSGHLVLFERLKAQAGTDDQKRLIEALASVNYSLWQVNDLFVKFRKIPTVSSDKNFQDVQTAVHVLDEEKTLTGGPALYRGLLRLATLRYQIEHFRGFANLRGCQVDFNEIGAEFGFVRVEVTRLLKDFQAGTASDSSRRKFDALLASCDRIFGSVDQRLQKLAPYGPTDVSRFLTRLGAKCE